jgi:hypothetical protein
MEIPHFPQVAVTVIQALVIACNSKSARYTSGYISNIEITPVQLVSTTSFHAVRR